MRLISLFLTFVTVVCASKHVHVHQPHPHQHYNQDIYQRVAVPFDAPRPLILSNYLNTPDTGRALAQVLNLTTPVVSYAGYFTVDSANQANLFTWFFPALNGNTKAPLLVWLNGGPGSTSMYGLFAEFGPFEVQPDGATILPRAVTWSTEFNIIFVDNPVGTGLSYTIGEGGYCNNQLEVAADLFNMLQQWYRIFPQYQQNDFYVTGESYAGKYVPSFATKIDAENMNPSQPHQLFVNLKGISIGDGVQDPITQLPGYGDLLFNLGMASEHERDHFVNVENEIVAALSVSDFNGAFLLFDSLLNGDFYPYPTYYTNITGLTNYFNFRDPDYPASPFDQFLNQPIVKYALHVDPAYVFSEHNNTVEAHLLGEWLKSVKPIMPNLLNKYKVLIYNGQNDIILSAPACENYLRTLSWNGAQDFNNAEKKLWKIHPTDRQVAGYVLQAHKFTYVVVRDAGHLLPQDQPERAYDMITRFIYDQPY